MTRSLSGRWGLLIAFVLGVVLSLAFAPFGVFALAILCPAALFLMWEGAAPRRAAALGFWFGAGTFFAGTYWLYISIHEIGDAPIWLALFLMLCLVAVMGLYHALVGYVAARWLPPTGLWRWLLGVPALWVLVEWLRGWVLSGFPWLALGYSQIDSWLAGYAPVGGVYAISLLVAVSAGVVMTLVRGDARARIVAGAALIVIWGGGALLMRIDWTEPVGEALTVSLVQGAIPQNLKWQADNREQSFKVYNALNEKALGSRIIVWPEAALPLLVHELEHYLNALQTRAQARGSDIVMGLVRYDFKDKQYRNSLLALTRQRDSYDKRRLVPFGEFFPVPDFVRSWMRLMSLPYVDISKGDEEQPALGAAGQKLGVTICYEDAYGSQQLKVLRDATLLVNVTNDAWFGDSTAPHQHLEIARMRAREAGRYLLRAANDGITATIGPKGELRKTIPQFKAGVLSDTVEPRTGLTPYARVGNIPVIVLSLVLLAIGAARRLLTAARSCWSIERLDDCQHDDGD